MKCWLSKQRENGSANLKNRDKDSSQTNTSEGLEEFYEIQILFHILNCIE